LTIGFARRVSTYKRLTLMLQDPERLRRILLDADRPVQMVLAGKSHPADRPGQDVLQELVRFAHRHGVRHRIVCLPDHELQEASGTSGMKAVLNGGLSLSVSDGWWDEMKDDEAGWTIPTADVEDQGHRDRLEAEALYELLEDRVVPLFYERDARGMQRGWMNR